jgi:glycosyltransferase involved in cell wall biosynthesis
MARIAVYQPTFGRGGAEAVCLNVLATLQEDHDLTLLTLADPDLAELDDYFGTGVSTPVPVRRLGPAEGVLVRSHRGLSGLGGLGRLHASVHGRLVRRVAPEYDLLVSTFGEFALDHPSVQYVHFPVFNRHRLPGAGTRGPLRRLYDHACDLVSGHRRRVPTDATLLANSEWTADTVRTVHGLRPQTLYPPVDTSGFEPRPWAEREPGIVAVGRVAPQKRTHVVVEIANQLARAGYDLPLRVVGPVGDRQYYRRLRERAGDTVRFEGAVDRGRLLDLLSTYRYGLHGTRNEHFGIAVAEFVAGGAVPLVHDSGGQREVVTHPALRYDGVDDAVRKLAHVDDDDGHRRRVRAALPDVTERFGRERFRAAFRAVVSERLRTR